MLVSEFFQKEVSDHGVFDALLDKDSKRNAASTFNRCAWNLDVTEINKDELDLNLDIPDCNFEA